MDMEPSGLELVRPVKSRAVAYNLDPYVPSARSHYPDLTVQQKALKQSEERGISVVRWVALFAGAATCIGLAAFGVSGLFACVSGVVVALLVTSSLHVS